MGTIQMLLGGLGLLQTIPLFATLGVERGWWSSIQEIFHVFVTGGPLHFMFHIQTKAQYMAQTILVGGAKYRATGRGFVTQHTPYDEQFRFFASSHIYMGIELAAGLILMWIYTDADQYFGRTWSLWLASLSFLASPFWFNPLTFDWNIVVNDYSTWLRWMVGTSGGATKSWSIWWSDENSFYRGMGVTSKMLYIIKAVLYLLFAEGIRRSDLFKSDTTLNIPVIAIGDVLIFIVVLFVLSRIFTSYEYTMPYPVRRTLGILIFIGLVGGIFTLFVEDSNYVRFALSAYYAIGAVCMIGLLFGVKSVKLFYMIHDFVIGHIIFIPLFLLAALQLPRHIQTWLLYHNALSTDVVVSDILRYARKTQESGGSGDGNNEDMLDQIAELRKIVQKQEEALASAGIVSAYSTSIDGAPAPLTSTVGKILSSKEPEPQITRPSLADQGASGFSRGRAMSLSGIDVWSSMAVGDVDDGIGGATGAENSSGAVPPSGSGSSQPSMSQGFSFTQPDVMPPR